MKKRILTALLASAMILSAASCGEKAAEDTTTTAPAAGGDAAATDAPAAGGDAAATDAPAAGGDAAAEEGKVLNIHAWNEEFKGFFEKYYAGTKPVNAGADGEEGTADDVYYDKAPGIPEGVEVVWTITPSDGGAYQTKVDEMLKAQETAAADDKVDFFLAEADYILKYAGSDKTLDVSTIGVTQADTMYNYTAQAASDANGKMKGVSFQCCPSALIYRRSIAKEVIGSDDPADVQAALSDWTKFEEVAAKAKDLGYYMTASYAETYRTFSNNATEAWVDADNNLVIPGVVKEYIAQAKKFMDNGWTLPDGIWGDEKNAQMFAGGKTMCFFGPAWYYNFSMGNAQDPDAGCFGDWAICQGPQAHFWGGTWLLAATGTDNPTLVADIMNAFTINEDICSALVQNEKQFSNNTTVNQKFADDPNYGNAFLGGQNDTAIFVELAKNIKFENSTIYDQLLNEGLPGQFLGYFEGTATEEEAYAAFYQYVNENYPAIVTP
ncbi:MAG: carbohydrate ABC transporter substrate-binding protein [Ruminiclostridium sp.]|nr:carbohydrate ABC transporter substrate-binding protein [Ruminiclostridium sp.]